MNTARLQALRTDAVTLANRVAASTRQIGVLAGFPGLGKTFAALRAIVAAVLLGLKIVLVAADYRILAEVEQRLHAEGVRCRLLRGRRRSCRAARQWCNYDRLKLFSVGYNALCKDCPDLEECEHRQELATLLADVDVVLVTTAKAGVQDRFLQKVMAAWQDLRFFLILDEDAYVRGVRHEHIPLGVLHDLGVLDNTLTAPMATFLANPGQSETHILRAVLQDIKPIDLESAWHARYSEAPCPLSSLQEALSVSADDRWVEGYLLHSIRRPQLLGPALICAQLLRPSLVRHYCEIPDGVLNDPAPPINEMFDGTRVFNWVASMGSDGHFLKNAGTIIRGFTPLILREVEAGRRLLLVARKDQLAVCKHILLDSGTELGRPWTVVTSVDKGFVPEEAATPAPDKLVVIHYGLAGINAFEHFDGVICLSSFYVPAWALNVAFNAPLRASERVWGQIVIDEQGYRVARLPAGTPAALQRAYEDLFLAMEHDVVFNTIGRVRPWTHPRLVVLQQRTRFDIQGLITARSQAELLSRIGGTGVLFKDAKLERRRSEIHRLQAAGRTQTQISEHLGISTRQIRRIQQGNPANSRADITPN